MRVPRAFPGSVPSFVFLLALVGPLAGQDPDPLVKPDKDASNPAVEIKGEAKVSVHPYKMEKGSTYRITVKGDGFIPHVSMWIPDQNKGTIINANNQAPGLNLGGFTQPVVRGNVAQLMFSPTETKVYQIKVDYALGTDIQKSPNAYTLTVEKAAMKPVLRVSEPRLETGEYTKRLEQGKVYGITVTGKGFGPEVQILEGNRMVASAYNGRWYGFGPDSESATTVIFTPGRTMDYRILIGVGPLTEKRQAPLVHTTQIVELKMALSAQGQITNQDPIDVRIGSPFKMHTVKLMADKTYQIDMTSSVIDSYLILEDSGGKLLMQDDDSGGNLNARIVFRPTKTDTYRVVATVFKGGVPNFKSSTGPYTLTVVENPHAQPRIGGAGNFGSNIPSLDK